MPPSRADGYREPLNDASLARTLTGVHSVIDGEVAADHVGPSSSGVLCQLIRLVINIRGVLPVIHTDGASVAVASAVR